MPNKKLSKLLADVGDAYDTLAKAKTDAGEIKQAGLDVAERDLSNLVARLNDCFVRCVPPVGDKGKEIEVESAEMPK